MMSKRRNVILIVEDDPTLSEQYKALCGEALRQLRNGDGPEMNHEIIQAYSYQEARQIITNTALQIGFASIDMALAKDEQNMLGARAQPGGMRVLQALQAVENPPVAVVVTGESRRDYAEKALQYSMVFSFLQKDFLDISEYICGVKFALWYQYLCEITARLGAKAAGVDLEMAEFVWQRTKSLAIEAGREDWPALATIKAKIDAAGSSIP